MLIGCAGASDSEEVVVAPDRSQTPGSVSTPAETQLDVPAPDVIAHPATESAREVVTSQPNPVTEPALVGPTAAGALVVEPPPRSSAPPPAFSRPPNAAGLSQPPDPEPFARLPQRTPLCVAGIDSPDTLNVRAGPGTEHPVLTELLPDSCVVRVNGLGVAGWQPVTVLLAWKELKPIDGYVSSTYVAEASTLATAEAAVVSQISHEWVLTRSDNPQPCVQLSPTETHCAVTMWHWQPAPHVCTDRTVSHWTVSSAATAMAELTPQGWVVPEPLGPIFDC